MPVPVPSSPIMTLVTFSARESTTTSRLAPARSALRTLLTKVHWPRRAMKILVGKVSIFSLPIASSISLSFYGLLFLHISSLSSSK